MVLKLRQCTLLLTSIPCSESVLSAIDARKVAIRQRYRTLLISIKFSENSMDFIPIPNISSFQVPNLFFYWSYRNKHQHHEHTQKKEKKRKIRKNWGQRTCCYPKIFTLNSIPIFFYLDACILVRTDT